MSLLFTTKINPDHSKFDINYTTPVVLLGSCFSDHIGEILNRLKMPLLQNPFGVLYNPTSIAQSIEAIIQRKEIKPTDLILHDKTWHSFAFHGSYSSPDQDKILTRTNESIHRAHTYLKSAKYLIVTFGTAWVFKHQRTNCIVSNCHKIPAREFKRFRLSVETITSEWNNTIRALQKFNPDLQLIFTVSPIRHLKDGAHQNQLSKSTLLLAVDQLINTNSSSKIEYFPSYEIIHDELRDYRFYADDMVHIAPKAIQYIFDLFKSTYFSKIALNCMNDINTLKQATEHRILTTDLHKIQNFKYSMQKNIEKLELKYPDLDFQTEKRHFDTTEQI